MIKSGLRVKTEAYFAEGWVARRGNAELVRGGWDSGARGTRRAGVGGRCGGGAGGGAGGRHSPIPKHHAQKQK